MKPEEHEIYVIPPNFIEGGTLFGGLFKTRNAIEAGVLGILVGVPVFSLPFSLTAKIILLCLTALPLVLLALIGVAGGSLSTFILLFFSYLRNRRVLSREPDASGDKKRKSILPSWAGRHSQIKGTEDDDQPKSRSRFAVDLKSRKVTQFKTFLPAESAAHPLNPLADYIPIEKIEHGIVYTKDHRYIKI